MALPGFVFSRFPATVLDDGTPDGPTAAWMYAASAAFHDSVQSDEQLRQAGANVVRDARTYTSVYDEAAPDGFDGKAVPIATFGTFPKQLNLGRDRFVDAHLITGVTVRPTHRRRGLLRELMTNDLHDAAERGFGVALLTASEASIYRRFGFGKASFTRVVRVDTGPRFALLNQPAGRIEVVDPLWLAPRTEQLFTDFHRSTAGSLERTARYKDSVLGAKPGETGPAASTRAAVHVAADGTIDGYVTFRVEEGKLPGEQSRLEVIDLIWASDDAYLGLWQHLASVDLMQLVRWDSAPIDDPLTWALRDSRCIAVESVEDMLWVRILDVVSSFEARPYLGDGSVTIRVHDALGYAAGDFRIEISSGSSGPRDSAGSPTVTRLGDAGAADGIDLELDASTLGSLLLGSVRPSVLARAGDATIAAGAAERLDAFFAPTATPYCISHF